MTHDGLRPSPPRLPASQAFAQFEATLEAEGLRSALAYLLCLSGFDCIGIYRVQTGSAAVLVHVDRRCAAATLQALPDEVRDACLLRDERGVLTTFAAAHGGGVAPSSMQARCCSLPVLDPEGRLLGTLCHHADTARSCDELDLLLLLQATSAIARGGWLDHAGALSPAGLAAA
jgi:hypothetical protein